MLNKKGQTAGAEEASGSIAFEVLLVLVFLAIIGTVLKPLLFESSIDENSLRSFERLDNVVRERAKLFSTDENVAIQLDSDYALVLFDETPDSCTDLQITKPLEKCEDSACLCICEVDSKSEMCVVGNSKCFTYNFDISESCTYYRGKSNLFSLNVMNINGSISVSTPDERKTNIPEIANLV